MKLLNDSGKGTTLLSRLLKGLAALALLLAGAVPRVADAAVKAKAEPSFSERAAKVKKAIETQIPSVDSPSLNSQTMQWGNWGNWNNWNDWNNAWGNWNNWNNWANWFNW